MIAQRGLARRALRLVAQCATLLDDHMHPVAPLATRVQTLVEEHARLASAHTCVVCWKQKRDAIFFPCHHVATCMACALRLDGVCCICRTVIDTCVRVYVA